MSETISIGDQTFHVEEDGTVRGDARQMADVGPGLTEVEKVESGMGQPVRVIPTADQRIEQLLAMNRILDEFGKQMRQRAKHAESEYERVREAWRELLGEKFTLAMRTKKLEAALKAVEWSSCDACDNHHYCPACGEPRIDNFKNEGQPNEEYFPEGIPGTHKPGCVVGEALSK